MKFRTLPNTASLIRSWYTGRHASGFSVTLEVAFRCNVRCVFCSRWDDPNDLELSVIREIADDMREMKADYVSLTGGDPFVRKDIREIIDIFVDRGVPIHINTNGVLLRRYADFLLERSRSIVGITVSIDSADPHTHDEIRGVTGTFDKAIAGIERIRNGIPVSIACTLNQRNLGEIEQFDRFCKEKGYDYRFQPLHEDGSNQLTPNQDGVAVEDAALEGLTARLVATLRPDDGFWKSVYYRMFEPFFRDRQSLEPLRCTAAARTIFFVAPTGDVYPCDTRRDVVLGNVRRERLSDIVRGPAAQGWRTTCRRHENGCWCMYACIAPANLRNQYLPLLPVTRAGWPVDSKWRRDLARSNRSLLACEGRGDLLGEKPTLQHELPFVSAIVSTFNGAGTLRETLGAIVAMDYPADRRELVVVDDGSTDGSIEEIEREFEEPISEGSVRVVRLGVNRGVPVAYNAGFRAASPGARYLLKVDNDVIPDVDALRQLVMCAESNPGAGIVGGRVFHHGLPARVHFLGGNLRSRLRGPACVSTPSLMLEDPPPDRPVEVDVVNSCFALIRRQLLERVGLLAEEYGPYEYEDYDFSVAARRFGFSLLYWPQAVVHHRVSWTSNHNRLSGLRAHQRIRNGVLFTWRHARRRWRLPYLGYTIAKIPFDVVRGRTELLPALRGVRDGLRLARRAAAPRERLPPPTRDEPRAASSEP